MCSYAICWLNKSMTDKPMVNFSFSYLSLARYLPAEAIIVHAYDRGIEVQSLRGAVVNWDDRSMQLAVKRHIEWECPVTDDDIRAQIKEKWPSVEFTAEDIAVIVEGCKTR